MEVCGALEHIFVITIRPERLVIFENRLGVLCENLTVCKGVNGRELDKKVLTEKGIISKDSTLLRGEIGCYLSHRACWEYIVKNNISNALIFEDDAEFGTAAQWRLKHQVIPTLPSNWNLVLLARNRKVVKDRVKINGMWAIPGRSWGLWAYMISIRVARSLLHQSLPINEAVDTFVSSTRGSGIFALRSDLCGVQLRVSDTSSII
jgi:glycosyl transferase family 25